MHPLTPPRSTPMAYMVVADMLSCLVNFGVHYCSMCTCDLVTFEVNGGGGGEREFVLRLLGMILAI